MIHVTDRVSIGEDEIRFSFIRASGPGGRKVDKTATAVQLRFDVGSSYLPADVRDRLVRLAGGRLTADGTIVIDARRYRFQEQNRKDAINRLVELIRKAAQPPKGRRRTVPPLRSKRRRIENKRRRGTKKRLRRPVRPAGEE